MVVKLPVLPSEDHVDSELELRAPGLAVVKMHELGEIVESKEHANLPDSALDQPEPRVGAGAN